MPAVQPSNFGKSQGWAFYGPELLRMKDRKGGDFRLGPTTRKSWSTWFDETQRSWRFSTQSVSDFKFRDEIRPRAGLMRGREFIMKDAYSFDVDDAAANESYINIVAYQAIFT